MRKEAKKENDHKGTESPERNISPQRAKSPDDDSHPPAAVHKPKKIKKYESYDEKPNSIPQNTSLVKYDTPFLVSTNLSNKRALDELNDSNEKTINFFKIIINKGSEEGDRNSEYDDFSVKDALNKIIPPKKQVINDQLWVQYVSCTPVTKEEVLKLKEGLDKKLKLNAKETGICEVREQLYEECFAELIRQVTVNCLERGIILMRVKNEIETTRNTYKSIYLSAISYALRTYLVTNNRKIEMKEKVKKFEYDNRNLVEQIEILEKQIKEIEEVDNMRRKEDEEEHMKFVVEYRKRNAALKDEIKNKLATPR